MKKFKSHLQELRNPSDIKSFKTKVSGIKNVDNRDESWRPTLEELMKKNGFKASGRGKYGSVFINKSYPYVIKVFMKDTAYLKFLDFAFANKRNKYLPKFKGKVIKINNMFMAIRMEKLLVNENINSRELVMLGQDPEDFLDGMSDYKTIPKTDKDALDICDYFTANRKLMDMHNGNVMTRSNGSAVIIDPFYNWFKPGAGGFVMDPDDVSKFEKIF